MKVQTTAAVALVALVAMAGVAAAAPGNAPDQAATADSQYEHSDDVAESADNGSANDGDRRDNAADDGDLGVENSDEAAADEGASANQGPPVALPEQVPEFVSQIHETIGQYLDGAIDALGEAISSIASNENAAPDNPSGNGQSP